jgi:hypothetical protein
MSGMTPNRGGCAIPPSPLLLNRLQTSLVTGRAEFEMLRVPESPNMATLTISLILT